MTIDVRKSGAVIIAITGVNIVKIINKAAAKKTRFDSYFNVNSSLSLKYKYNRLAETASPWPPCYSSLEIDFSEDSPLLSFGISISFFVSVESSLLDALSRILSMDISNSKASRAICLLSNS